MEEQRLDQNSEIFIDGLRGVMALGVLVSHAFDIGIRRSFVAASQEPDTFWHWMASTIGYGGMFVCMFFVISGLCIHQSIAKGLRQGTFDGWQYFRARVTRLYPVFLVGLVLSLLILPLGVKVTGDMSPHPWRQWWASFFMLHAFTGTFPGFMPSWSLSNEAVYYAVWPLALFWSGLRVKRAAAVSLAVLMGFALLFVVVPWFKPSLSQSMVLDGFWTIGVLYPLWLVGALLASRWGAVSAWVTPARWRAGIAWSVATVLLTAALKIMRVSPPWIHAWSLLSIPGLVLVVAGGRHMRLAASARARAICHWLALLSYPCYILHFPLMSIVTWAVESWLPAAWLAIPLLRVVLLLVPVALVIGIVGPWLERVTMAWRSEYLKNAQSKRPVVRVA